jgi:hypothetical protein
MLDALSPDSAAELVSFFEGRDWTTVDWAMRHDVLVAVDDAIVRMRERHLISPIDDSLLGEPPTVFEVLRQLLTGVGHHRLSVSLPSGSENSQAAA